MRPPGRFPTNGAIREVWGARSVKVAEVEPGAWVVAIDDVSIEARTEVVARDLALWFGESSASSQK